MDHWQVKHKSDVITQWAACEGSWLKVSPLWRLGESLLRCGKMVALQIFKDLHGPSALYKCVLR